MSSILSHEASVLALYGLHFSPDRAEACYRHLVEWFDSLGCHPDRSEVSGDGFSENVGVFDRFDNRLKRSGFEGVRGFSLYRLVPGGDIPGYDWSVNAEVYQQESYCIIGARSSIAPIPGDSMLSIGRTLIRDLSPVYGIGFRREMSLGPSLYAMGGCMGLQPWGAEKPEGDRIERWRTFGIEQRVYETGLLRDVYPWNLLTHLQLNQQIDGIPLGQWIEQDQNCGSLSVLVNNIWLWEVPEAQMRRVRLALGKAGIVFDARPTGNR
jgi:hypothetical protein